MAHILYQLHHHRFLGWSLLRWGVLLLLLYALTAWFAWVPGGRVGAAAALVLIVVLLLMFEVARRRCFVRFHPLPRAAVALPDDVVPLSPGEKIPARVTGLVAVGKREQIVVHAPGYLERFRSGEKAISALVNPSRFLGVGALPPQYEGLWYMFIKPGSVKTMDVGHVVVQGERCWTLRITLHDASRSRPFYLSFARAEDLQRALAAFERF